ncbi:MAG TPA: 2-hydroxyacid dehydrogenase [Actinotalea sp.]|nr:2-hydroxyacid dehydrogenase [Actinotalea sp.]
MLTITVAHDDQLEGLVATPLPPGVRVERWDLREPLPSQVDPGDVDVVVVPHYLTRPESLRLLHDLPNLRVVQLPSAGYEHAVEHLPPGVALCNGRGVHDAGTAELAVALVLASQRGIDQAVRDRSEHRWAPTFRSSLADRRVLVLGHGSIGRAIIHRLEAFEVEVVAVAGTAREDGGRHVHAVGELPALLPTADVVVVIVPLTAATHHLVDAAFLAAMPDGALLVNVARGKVVDTDALLAELTAGRLRAALDVTDPEPLPADHPLWDAPNLVLTPHVGGYTDATGPRFLALLRRQVAALHAGAEPLNVVVRT